MLYTLLYTCKDCNLQWEDIFEEKYGECDDECENCGKAMTPIKNEWRK
jgi:hypothetical protein